MEKQFLRKMHLKHLLVFVMCFASMTRGHAQFYDFKADNNGVTIYYGIQGKNAVVVAGENLYAGDIIVPSTVINDGISYSVTEIGNFAFDECTGLESITLPSSLQKIGMYAFSSCTSLRSISIPNNVTSIGHNAFYGCINLNTTILPSSLKSIEDNTFDGCKNLKTINIPYGVKHIGSKAFGGCRMMASVTIPNSVNSIEAWAFEGCSNLGSLILPEQLTSIEKYVFSGCSKIKELVIPNSVTVIEEYAFWNCSGLKSLTIPNSICFIGDWAFTGCKAIQKVLTAIEEPFDIGNYVFEQNVKKTAVLHVPYGLKSIYANTNGWNFSNIEEEPQSHYSLILWGRDGNKIATYELKDKPIIKFTNSEIVMSSSSVDIVHYGIDGFSKFTYEDEDETGVINILTNEPIFKYNGESLQFHSLQGNTRISVYSINGTCVLNKTVQQPGTYAFPISHLQSGVYLINVNSLTYKISKK